MKIARLLPIIRAIALIKMFKARIPLFVSWQITERCNLRCKYCDYWMGKKEEELTTQEIFKIIDELHSLGTLGISFTGGEPLLRGDIGEILTYAKIKNIITKINTNGLLIPEKIREIKGAEQINLSFDGPEHIHDQIRGLGSYKALLEAIKVLKGNKKKVVFHVTLTKYNLDCINFILDKCCQLNIGAFFQPATEFYLLNRNINPHSPDRQNYARAMVLLLQKKRRGDNFIYNSISGLKHLSHWPDQRPIYCSAGRIMFRINSQGQFYHCERFARLNKINCIEKSVRFALDNLQPVSCKECWCGSLVELNLLMSIKFNAIMNSFRL